MYRTSVKRAAAGVAALALSGVSLIAMAPAASAAEENATDLSAASSEYIIAATTAQPAGNLVVGIPALDDDDTVTITVHPQGGSCDSGASVQNDLGFADVPASNNAKVIPTLTNTAGCDLKNRLILTADGAVAAGNVTISSIEYTSGAKIDDGAVRVSVTGVAFSADDSNAFVGVDRTAGADRYETAANVARASAACANDVVLVSGENFPDALAAAFLQRPILLTKPGSLPDATKKALDDLGTKNVTIVGGTQAVSDAVETALEGLDEGDCAGDGSGKIVASRTAGETRYDTARAVAMSQGAGAAGTFDNGINGGACDAVKTAILVSGQNFPDALAAGALSSSGAKGGGGCGTGRIPLLLTPPTSLSGDAVEALDFLDIEQVIVVGGTQAVNASVFTAIESAADVDNVERVFGENRTLTAAELAEVLLANDIGNFAAGYMVAVGTNFPDALAAGPAAGAAGRVILLATSPSSLGAAATDVIDKDTSPLATLLGGTTALQSGVATEVRNAFNGR